MRLSVPWVAEKGRAAVMVATAKEAATKAVACQVVEEEEVRKGSNRQQREDCARCSFQSSM